MMHIFLFIHNNRYFTSSALGADLNGLKTELFTPAYTT